MSDFTDQLRRELDAAAAEPARFNGMLRLLAKYRCLLLQRELIRRHGTDVIDGPFKGMHFIEQSAEGCHIPKLLGCYEEEIQPFIQTVPGRDYAAILNIGCAEGYYAVGFKRLCPGAHVVACDTDPRAREACKALANKNGVTLDVRGMFPPEDFAEYAGCTLVWCDIEGAERELLDPARAPALANMDIVVELHPDNKVPMLDIVPPRFAGTHDISIVWPRAARRDLPPMFRGLGHLDQLLAIWEWRVTPTPWAIMLAKGRGENMGRLSFQRESV